MVVIRFSERVVNMMVVVIALTAACLANVALLLSYL